MDENELLKKVNMEKIASEGTKIYEEIKSKYEPQDTGFTGELKLSAKEAIDLGISSTHLKFVQLANGEKSQMYAGLAMVSMEGVENMVSALISGGMPIIGVGLLKRF